jgi:hypothetical protein
VKIRHLLYLVLYALLAPVPGARAQSPSYGVSAGVHYGFLAAHNPSMLHLVDSHVSGWEVTFFHQTNGIHAWEQAYNYPQTSLTLLYLDLPADTVLGNAWALMAGIDFPLIRTQAYTLAVRPAAGPGYLTRHFERVENHKDNAIGSAFNIAVQVSFRNTLQLTPRIALLASLGLSHFSNGSFSTPNLGVNNVTACGGITVSFSAPDTFYRQPPPAFDRLWTWDIACAAGVKEIYPPDNGKYFGATLTGNVLKQFSHKSAAGAGADLFYDTALPDLVEQKERQPSDVLPVRAGLHVSYHLVVGKMVPFLDFGVYLLDPYKDQGPFYHRIGVRWQQGRHLFLNVSLKTHYAKAEIAEWGLGWKFAR